METFQCRVMSAIEDKDSLNFEIHGLGAYNLKGQKSARGCICQNIKSREQQSHYNEIFTRLVEIRYTIK